MEAATLAALVASAEKWERNATAERPQDAHIYSDSCPLCAIFDRDEDVEKSGVGDCRGCPVFESERHRRGCENTPWESARTAWRMWAGGVHDWAVVFRKNATKEAEFLRSLIPEEHR